MSSVSHRLSRSVLTKWHGSFLQSILTDCDGPFSQTVVMYSHRLARPILAVYSHRLSRSILTDCRCLCLLTGTVHSCRSFSRTVTAHSHRLARSKASGQLTTVVNSCVAGASSRTSRQHNLTTSQHYSWHSLKSTEKTLTCTDIKASPTGTHRNCRGSDYSWTHTIFLNEAEHLRACPNLTVPGVQHLQTS